MRVAPMNHDRHSAGNTAATVHRHLLSTVTDAAAVKQYCLEQVAPKKGCFAAAKMHVEQSMQDACFASDDCLLKHRF